MLKKIHISIWCVLLSFFILNGQTLEEQMQTANDAFQAKNYAKAIETYEALLAADAHSYVLYYNLGNSYYRSGEIGRAILNYERAQLYQPNDPDVQHNLMVARQQLVDDLDILPDFFLWRWWRSASLRLSSRGWSLVGLLLLWVGISGLIWWMLAKERSQKVWGFSLGLLY